MEEGAPLLLSLISPFFQGNVGWGGLCLNAVFSQFIQKGTPYKEILC